MSMLLRAASCRGPRPWLRGARAMGTAHRGALALPPEIHRRVHELPLSATYDPEAVESGWHEYWQRAIAEKKRNEDTTAPYFTMLLPPPNVTGALHIGHALTITIQDALARWHHMRGFNVRWIPGLDHAGIATQSVVERKIAQEEGKSKHDLGREVFLDRVWQWNEQYGGRIMQQIDQLGAVVNKDESYFTLDEDRSRSVIEAFVELYDRGLVYRKRRMVNWCPTLKTAISDIEVDSESLEGPTMKKLPGRVKPVEFGVMHRILYKVADSDDFLQVDTTRPETIFGDVAVAIHPDDPRYKRFHGKHVVHPFSGERIPVILDSHLVNMDLGTGVVKITPAHDPKDYECGLRHQLPEPVVIDQSGRMCGAIKDTFLGMDRFEAREAVIEEMKAKKLYVTKLDHQTTLSLCSRSGDVIEPLLMPQWYVNCQEMAKRAVDHVRSGNLVIEPKSHERMWFHFLENIQDWCVSRQLWWGHRVPAYRVHIPGYDDEWVIARTMEEAHAKAAARYGVNGKISLEQDGDVLDTWFSSGLLPISVFGWPAKDPAESPAYPISIMETGSDILFFWVARMAMLCEELSSKSPFKRILLHPMVRDKGGRKMSKSLGNVIDPIHVIRGINIEDLLQGLKSGNIGSQEMRKAEKDLLREFPQGIPACGTDALRYSLASYLQQGRQINMDLQRVISHRQFCNKIWNAVRFALPLLEMKQPSDSNEFLRTEEYLLLKESLALSDRWILSRLAATVETINEGMDSNQLAASVAAFHRFFIQELCDVYIEFSKPVLYGNRLSVADFTSEEEFRRSQTVTRSILFTCLDYSMRLLHPFAPFVTEELWQRIRTFDPSKTSSLDCEALLFAKYPEPDKVSQWIDHGAEKEMNFVLEVLHSIRSLRHTVRTLAPTGSSHIQDLRIKVMSDSSAEIAILSENVRDLETQSRNSIEIVRAQPVETYGVYLTHSISQTCKVLFPVPNDPDTPKRLRSEIERLNKRLAKIEATLQSTRLRQSSPGYGTKVPANIQEQEAARIASLETEIVGIRGSIDVLAEFAQQQHY